MTVSMRVMSAGDCYKYLLRSVAAGDGDRSLSTPLTRYYAEAGTPPGRWLGADVAALGGGRVGAGDQVSEAQLQLLVGMGRDPIAGFDFTFSIPKSASVLWAVADVGTQTLIADVHHAAVAEVVAFMEREVAATCTGATGPGGLLPLAGSRRREGRVHIQRIRPGYGAASSPTTTTWPVGHRTMSAKSRNRRSGLWPA